MAEGSPAAIIERIVERWWWFCDAEVVVCDGQVVVEDYDINH